MIFLNFSTPFPTPTESKAIDKGRGGKMDDKLKAAVDSVAQQYYFHGFLSREDASFLLYRLEN